MKKFSIAFLGLLFIAFSAFAEAPAGLTSGGQLDNNPRTNPEPQLDWPVVDSIAVPANISNPTGLTWDGQNFWLTDYRAGTASSLYQVSPAGIVLRFLPPPDRWPCGITWDGTYLWVHDYVVGHSQPATSMSMCKVDTANGTVLSMLVTHYTPFSGGVAWDGQNLWYGMKGSSNPPGLGVIYKMDPNTGAHLDSIPLPLGDIFGLTYFAEHLYYSDSYHDRIYKIDLNGNHLDSTDAPGTMPRGLTFDGEYLWNVDDDTRQMYKFEVALPTLSVTLTPHNPPIQIPAGGGGFSMDAEVANSTAAAINFDAWTLVILPNGLPYGPLVLRQGLTIPAGATIMRVLSQNVPGAAPPGNYIYRGFIGVYPDSVTDSTQFPFAKLAGDGAPGEIRGWEAYGWDDETAPATLSEFNLLTASPNPFNPETGISFTTAEAGYAELAVYDVSGREVAKLAEDWYPAGSYQFTWNAADLPSGVYFARLNANGADKTAKLLLLK